MSKHTNPLEKDIRQGENGELVSGNSWIDGICEELVLFPGYDDQYPVYISMPVWRQLWQYACDNKDREIGGVLLGRLLQDDNGDCLNIQAYLPGRYMEETLASLTFTYRTWSDINQRHMREHNDKRIIGWFHTHPGHGIFMSRYDLYIHHNYFAGEGQVAVVFDPVHNSAGFFQRQDHLIRQLRGIHIYTQAGYVFDQNTCDFIDTVRKHSLPECQPTLAMSSTRIDILTGPLREEQHQGLAFLLRLMDVQKQVDSAQAVEESKAPSSNLIQPESTEEPAALTGIVSQYSEIASPIMEAQKIGDNSGAVQIMSSSLLVRSEPATAGLAEQLGENLDLYSGGLQHAPSKLQEMQGDQDNNLSPEGIPSFLYRPTAPPPVADLISGQNINLQLSAKTSRPTSFVQMTREIEEERLDLVKKKLTPIKDQVARDLRQAEREILSPSGNRRYEKTNQTKYADDFDTDSLNIMM